jgi:hypothetical protein
MSDPSLDQLVALCECGHDLERHDRISARFCAATKSGHLTRGCVCQTVSAEPPAPRTHRDSYQLDSYRR